MIALVKKEINAYLNSLVAYIVIGVFLLLTGLVTWFFKDSNVLDYGFADLTSFFSLTPWILVFIIPAITMRLFSEEYRTGTIEFLFTKPLSNWQIVLSKFFAAAFVLLLLLIPTAIYYLSVYQLGNPAGNIDTAAVIGAYIGLFLMGLVIISIGIFASSLTDNQIIAFVIGATLSYVFFDGIHQFALLLSGTAQYYLDYVSLQFHNASLSRGVIDSRNVFYLGSITVLFLFFTQLTVSKKTT